MKVKQEIQEKITATANALVAEGIEHPTNTQVRERMGGGSLSHISPVMRDWRESRKASVVAALDMPSELKKTVETSLAQLWGTACKLATASLEGYRKEAEAVIEEATTERDEALGEVQRLERHLEELTKALEEKSQALNQAHHETAQLKAGNVALQARIEDRESQINDLKADLMEARDNNRELQKELVELARTKG